MIQGTLDDVRFAWRILGRRPGLTVAAVAILALGVGGNTALFSAVRTLLFESPFRDVDRLVFVAEEVPEGAGAAISYPDLVEYQNENDVFENLAGLRLRSWNLTGTADPERVDGLQVSASLFGTLGVQPLLGRTFSVLEDRPGGGRVAVLGEDLWRRRFGGDPGVLDGTIRLDGTSYAVIGVMPAAFQIWRRVDLFTPISHQAAWTDRREWHCTYGVGRLRPGVSLEQARASMDVIAERLAASYTHTRAGRTSSLTPLRDHSLGDLRRALWALTAVSLLVLALGCISVAGLLHVHGFERTRELSIRVALGAGRSRLIRQVLVESLLLGLTGSVAGLLVAEWSVQLLSATIQRSVVEAGPLRLDAAALAFNSLAGLIAGLVSGLVPASLLTRGAMSARLVEGMRGTVPLGRARLQEGLVVAQVTLAVVTLVGASLVLRSFARLLAVPLGVQPKGVVLADLTLPQHRYPDRERLWRFYGAVLRESERRPEILSAALVTTPPMSFVPWNVSYRVEGEPPPRPGHEPECDYAAVGGEYFDTLGIRVMEGRSFNDRDDDEGVPVAIVDRSFARRHFVGAGAIGRRVSLPGLGGEWLQIVGVVDHVRNWGPDGVSLPEVYVPLLQKASPSVTLAVRVAGRRPMPGVLRTVVQDVDPDQPLARIRTMEAVVARTSAARRLSARLIAGFAAIALVLAGLGLYGTLSRSVTRRAREIGVRMALGARRSSVLLLFVRRGLLLCGIGLALGLGVALPLTPALSSQLFQTAPRDPVAIVLVALVLFGAALLASLFPARRAARIEPMVVLRGE